MEPQRTIAVQQCCYATLIQARGWLPPEIGTVTYFAWANPGQSPRFPIYAGTLALPESFKVDCQHSYREDAACWWVRRTNRLAQIKRGWARQYLEPAVMELQDQLFMEQPLIEQKALEMMKAEGGADPCRGLVRIPAHPAAELDFTDPATEHPRSRPCRAKRSARSPRCMVPAPMPAPSRTVIGGPTA
ncbi:MAG TPA: hypothetical protein VLH75_10275 [Longimicrobiales bacterium]|nr:hypothetical protein [Longimicrobiales bacterium]